MYVSTLRCTCHVKHFTYSTYQYVYIPIAHCVCDMHIAHLQRHLNKRYSTCVSRLITMATRTVRMRKTTRIHVYHAPVHTSTHSSSNSLLVSSFSSKDFRIMRSALPNSLRTMACLSASTVTCKNATRFAQ